MAPIGTRPLGALAIVVCGGVASTLNEAVAGVGSALSPETARTANS